MVQHKVVHMTTVHHPMDTRIFHKECASLANAAYDVTLIATDHPDLDRVKPAFKLIKLKKAANRWVRMTKNSWQAYRLAKQLEADVYHFHDPELIWVGWLLKNKSNHVIYDIHEDYETGIRQKKYLPVWARNTLAGIYRLVEKLCINQFEIVLAEKYYRDKYLRGVDVLNYPILQPMEDKPAASEEASAAQHNDAIHLLYTGNVTLDRGSELHAQIAKLDKRIHVHYVGKCAQSIADRVAEAAGEAAARVTIDGVEKFIARDAIDAYYAESRWLAGLALFPPTEHYAKKELTKFFEYMNAGLPIICSNFPSWEAFVKLHECGIAVDPHDGQAVLRAINELKKDPEKAARMGRNGRRAVREELNWVHEENKLLGFYSRLLTK
ncbi:glycosyltransferase [Paenibacillus sp. KS-LC4]|uniref:glycosyltransferase n=1 Tax=Paenibacillus sp. KS-LC4 TaxID=2979727 RepID=UPI0030CBBDBF